MQDEKKGDKTQQQYWETIPKKYDSLEKFKQLPPREQLARLYWYFMERQNNEKMFLRCVIRYGLEPYYMRDARLL